MAVVFAPEAEGPTDLLPVSAWRRAAGLNICMAEMVAWQAGHSIGVS